MKSKKYPLTIVYFTEQRFIGVSVIIRAAGNSKIVFICKFGHPLLFVCVIQRMAIYFNAVYQITVNTYSFIVVCQYYSGKSLLRANFHQFFRRDSTAFANTRGMYTCVNLCLVYHSDFSLQNLSENWHSSWHSGMVFSRLKPPQTRITTGFLISNLINRLHYGD